MRRFLLLLVVFLPLFALVASAEDVYSSSEPLDPLTDSAAVYLAEARSTPGYAYQEGLFNRVLVHDDGRVTYLPVSGDFSAVMGQVLSFPENAQVIANAVAPYVNDPVVLDVLKQIYAELSGREWGSSTPGANVMSRFGDILWADGTIPKQPTSQGAFGLADILANGFMGLFSSFRYTGALLNSNGYVVSVSDYSLPRLLSHGFLGLRSILRRDTYYLMENGTVSASQMDRSVAQLLASGQIGLSSNLAGNDKVTAFTILSSSDITQNPESVEVTNILDAISQLHNSLQPDLAKLRYVLASDDDIQMREDLEENYDSFKDTFIKPGAPGGASPSDIADMGSVSQNASSLVDTGVSVGQAFGQLNDASIFSFFTQETASDLDPVPVVISDDDEEWLPNLWEQQQSEFYSIIGGGE